ncbi:hypothetical protein [Thermoflavifilum thermophilum]|uniref:hypothetical protein n=1 Tax=Thermoflavifilum thermophilum TaxID=1393122 RepID=UPI00373FCF12
MGLILPWLLNLFPILTPIAASALAWVMVPAMFHHLKHRRPISGSGGESGWSEAQLL